MGVAFYLAKQTFEQDIFIEKTKVFDNSWESQKIAEVKLTYQKGRNDRGNGLTTKRYALKLQVYLFKTHSVPNEYFIHEDKSKFLRSYSLILFTAALEAFKISPFRGTNPREGALSWEPSDNM